MSCHLCKNVSADDKVVQNCTSGYICSIRETDVSKFDLLTDQILWYHYDILAAARPRANNEEFGEIEQSLGMNFVDGSLLGDKELREHVHFVDSCRIDPMHTYFQGIFGDEMFKFLDFSAKILGRGRDHWSSLANCCQGWEWPDAINSKGRALPEIFNQTRNKSSIKTKNFKCIASEALTCFPVARRWAEIHLQSKCI